MISLMVGIIAIELSQKSHSAPVSYPKMHHIETEMCTFLFQSDALWDMGQVHCGICEIGQHASLNRVKSMN